METGERIYNLKRLYNIKCGIGRKDDILPERFRKEPRHDTGTGEFLPDLETQLEEYYQARGWNKDGVPGKETLQRLGIA
ncbi:MAG: aldehyde ferredoxin oxidoreductase, partial [Synergistales bacterium]|nr:aldehyde ferredoxin oxidoreductase [Synergistales bacterium]